MSFWNDILENKVIDQLYEQAHSIQGTETSNVPLLLFTASNVVRAAAITVSSRAPGGGLAGALTSVWNKVTGATPVLPPTATADTTGQGDDDYGVTNGVAADDVMEEKEDPGDNNSSEIIHSANEYYEVVEIEEDDISLSSKPEIEKQTTRIIEEREAVPSREAEEDPSVASHHVTVNTLDPAIVSVASACDASTVREAAESSLAAVNNKYALIPFTSHSETHSESPTIARLPSLNTDLDDELAVDLMDVDLLENFIKSYSPACSRERPHDVVQERRMLHDLIQAITRYYRLALEELDIGGDHWDINHVTLPDHHDIIGLSKSLRNAPFASPVRERKTEEPSGRHTFQKFAEGSVGTPPPSLFGSIFSSNPPPQQSSNPQSTQQPPTAVRNLVRCLAVLRAIASTLLGVVRRAELQSPSSSTSSSRVATDSKSGSARAALPSSAVSSLRCWCWLSHEFIRTFLLGAVRESLESSQEGQNVAVYTVLRVVLQTLSWSGKDGVRDSTASILGSYDGSETIRDSSNVSDGNNVDGNGIVNGGEGSLGWNGPLTKMSLLSWMLRFMLLGPSSMELVQRCLLAEVEGGEVRGGSVEAEDRIGALAVESGSGYVGSPESTERKRVAMGGEREEKVKHKEEAVAVGTSSIAGSSSLWSGGWGEGELVWLLWDRMGSQSRPLSLSASLLLSCLLQHSPPLLSLSHVYSLPYGLAKTPVSDEVDEEGRGRLGGRMLMGSARGTERSAGFEELLSGMVSSFEKKESVSVDEVGIPGMSEGDCAMRRAYAKTACDLLSRVLFHGGDELLSLPSAYFDRYLFGVVGDGSRGVSSRGLTMSSGVGDVSEGVEDVKEKSFLGRLRRRLHLFAHLRIYEQIVLSDLVQQCMCELSVVMVLGSEKAARRSLELSVELLDEVKGLLGEVRLAATKQVADLSGKWSMIEEHLRNEAAGYLIERRQGFGGSHLVGQSNPSPCAFFNPVTTFLAGDSLPFSPQNSYISRICHGQASALRKHLKHESMVQKQVLANSLVLQEMIWEMEAFLSAVLDLRNFMSSLSSPSMDCELRGKVWEVVEEEEEQASELADLAALRRCLHTPTAPCGSDSSSSSHNGDGREWLIADLDGQMVEFLKEYTSLTIRLDQIVLDSQELCDRAIEGLDTLVVTVDNTEELFLEEAAKLEALLNLLFHSPHPAAHPPNEPSVNESETTEATHSNLL